MFTMLLVKCLLSSYLLDLYKMRFDGQIFPNKVRNQALSWNLYVSCDRKNVVNNLSYSKKGTTLLSYGMLAVTIPDNFYFHFFILAYTNWTGQLFSLL